MNFSEKLRQIRKSEGISQEELAEIVKVFDAKTDDLIFICSDREAPFRYRKYDHTCGDIQGDT